MSRIAYVNGRYVPHDQAEIHIDDRGYQFGDDIYEVVSVINGKLADQDWHLDRMDYPPSAGMVCAGVLEYGLAVCA